jgi:DNA polymerase III delta prime subunit
MAKMIPPHYHTDTKSKGEIEIFLRLRDDPLTKEWTVLHSLDIARHLKQVSGEIDFVVIVPGKGVLCVEVKACHHLERRDGQWYYGANTTPDPRGPFKQASQAMHSIRKRLVARDQSLSGVLFWSAVIFPYVPFAVPSEEWHPWQVIDYARFKARPLGALLEQVLDHARTFISEHPGITWIPKRAEPTEEQCRLITDSLRPDFEFFERPNSRRLRQDEELKNYTTEQFGALDAMGMNPRVLFSGPAGTGKTLLAIEAARRGCQAGRRVLFLCYNRLLGKWLGEQTLELGPRITCRTLHSHMLSVAGLPRSGTSNDFWLHELPSKAIDALLEEEGDEHQFDELVIDEAQDILRDNYLDFLDLSLRGGLASGRWMFFGDFEKQAIYSAADLSLEEFLSERANYVPIYSLRTNCRNTPRVAELVHLLGGLHPGYTRVLRPDDRVEPRLQYYAGDAEQQQMLLAALQQLYSEGFTGDEIVTLSPRAGAACAAGKITSLPWRDRVKPLEQAGRGHIGYSSIQAFKGLEAPVIIVTDIDTVDNDNAVSLFYISVTRALHRLLLFMHEDVKSDIAELLHIRV